MEIKEYVSALDKNTGDILQVLKECSEEQFERKDGDAWSILEILEHLLITDTVVHRLLCRPAKKQGDSTEIVGAEKLKRAMVGMRDHKISAPELLLPKGELKSESEFVEKFLKQRAFLISDLESGKIVLDKDIIPHAVIGDMSKRDWLHFIVFHSERHLLQIRELLSNM